ncbi:universal stress protein [Nocardioides sp.]|uniref:universal stress protein n=1 Tax=Nocardioides sp. TaxID=35761 RepID=UPI0023A78F42|nr:universal stress protein [Nocardioides sp.]MDE0776374.1 universal stress protein [Nocardioides sp.]
MTKNLDLPDLARGSIVVGVDGSDGSDEAVDWAADLAARSRRALTVLHTEAPPVPWNAVGYTGDLSAAPTLRESVLAAGGRITDAAIERARTRHPDLELGAVTGTVDPRRGLVEASHRAHLIVLGSRGRGPLASVLLGSVSREVSRSAACPVVVIRPGSHTGDHVLALVDGTPASLDVMEFAARQASDLQLPLRVDHLLWTAYELDPQLVEGARRLLAETCAGLGEKFPDVALTAELVHFTNPEELIEGATDAALVVVGHHPASRIHRILYRSVSAAILEHASVPVAVVPTDPS